MDPILAEEYGTALRDYLADGGERGLLRAHELGRRALDHGAGILELAALHHQAVELLAVGRHVPVNAEVFLLETLSPYEMTHQGFRDALESLRRVNETMEAEARRIAHALHDETSQSLAAACISLEVIGRDLPEEAKQRLKTIGASLRETAARLRQISHELRPTVLDDLGLVPGLEFLAEGFAARTGMTINISGDTDGRLPAPVETAIYRVTQEALANAFRHGRASRVEVRVRRTPDAVLATIRDDGCGFDAGAADRPRGLGVLGMKERVHALGGTFQVASEPGRGTEVTLALPLKANHADPHPAR